MAVFVAGATGRTGGLLVEQLLERGHEVRVVVRAASRLPAAVRGHRRLRVREAPLLDESDEALTAQLRGCRAAVSCLGHTLDLRGLFGEPRRLCRDAVRRLGEAIERSAPAEPVRLVLMSTVGVPDPDADPPRPRTERALLALLRHTVPPHRDNEAAAAELRERVGRRSPQLAWCIVRPDALVDAGRSPYEVLPSPPAPLLRGRLSARVNVAHFMAELIDDAQLWARWRFRAPVVVNTQPSRGSQNSDSTAKGA